MSIRSQKGMTLIELVMVVSTVGIMVAAATAVSLPLLAREQMRSALYDVQTFLQLAKIESVSKNRSCRFVIDASDGGLQVIDGMGTSTTSDDEVLYDHTLPGSVVFARPDSGSALGLQSVGGSVYQTVFSSDGIVSEGAGTVFLHDGTGFDAISIFVAGGVQAVHWDGSTWKSSDGTSVSLGN